MTRILLSRYHRKYNRDYLFHLWDPLIFFSQPMILMALILHALCLCSSGVLAFCPRMARMVTNLLSTDDTDDTDFFFRGTIASATRDYLFHRWDLLIFFSQPMILMALILHALCLCSSGMLVFCPRRTRMVTNLLSTDDTDDTDFFLSRYHRKYNRDYLFHLCNFRTIR